ncbi:MAG TPA: phosphatase PAP2 family protein, partial [Ktedonobacterales bacterium]
MNSPVDAGPPVDAPSGTPSVALSPLSGRPPAGAPTRGRAARILRNGTLFAVGSALLIYSAVWLLIFAVLALGPLGLLVYAALLGAALAVVAPLLLVRYRTEVRRPLAAIGRWVDRRVHAIVVTGQTATGTGNASWWQRLMQVLGIHAVWNRAARVWVLLGLGVALALVWAFGVVFVQVITGGTLTGTDLRVLNLVALLRTPTLDQAMYVLTYLGSVPTVIAVTAVGVGIALLTRRYADALLILVAPIVGGLFVEIVKLIVERPRPPLVDARIVATGISFPSGHATVATVLFGTLAYLLLRHFSTWPGPLRAAIAVAAAVLIFGIGLSRIYLGVHYPSDVLAGWVAGAIWLVLVDVTGHVAEQTSPVQPLSSPRRALATAGSVIVIAGAVASLVALYPPLPPPPALPVAAPVVLAPDGPDGVET